MDNDLGMNLFLDDEFFDENVEDVINPNEHIQTDLEDQDDLKQNNEEQPNEDESQDEVDGENTEDENDDVENDDTSSPPLYKSLASFLQTEGVLTSVDSSKLDNVKTPQDFADLIAAEVKAKELSDLTDLQREAVTAFRAGIDVETFKQQKETEDQLDNITEEVLESEDNADLRRQIIYQNFINKGLDEKKAIKYTDRSFEVGEDIEDAKEALLDIKIGVKERFEQQVQYEAKQRADAEDKRKKEQEKLKTTILSNEEPFKGIKVNETIRKKILDTMLIPVSKNPITGAEENALMKAQREDEDFARKLYTAFTLTNGFTDFTLFGKQAKTKVINDFEKVLKNNMHVIQGGDPSFLDDSNSSDNEIGDNIVFR